MNRIRSLLTAILLVALVAVFGAVGIHMLSGGSIRSFVAQPLPSAGEPAIEVDYEVNLNCAVPTAVGDTIWKFVGGGWPQGPQGVWIFQGVVEPYRVSGVVRLSSATTGVFDPDNGPPIPIELVGRGEPTMMCI